MRVHRPLIIYAKDGGITRACTFAHLYDRPCLTVVTRRVPLSHATLLVPQSVTFLELSLLMWPRSISFSLPRAAMWAVLSFGRRLRFRRLTRYSALRRSHQPPRRGAQRRTHFMPVFCHASWVITEPCPAPYFLRGRSCTMVLRIACLSCRCEPSSHRACASLRTPVRLISALRRAVSSWDCRTNADLSRLINSDEVQSKINPPKEGQAASSLKVRPRTRQFCFRSINLNEIGGLILVLSIRPPSHQVNPLKSTAAMVKLNPAAGEMKKRARYAVKTSRGGRLIFSFTDARLPSCACSAERNKNRPRRLRLQRRKRSVP